MFRRCLCFGTQLYTEIHMHTHAKNPGLLQVFFPRSGSRSNLIFCFALFPSGLRGELRAEEEKGKEKDQERRDLEETVDVLRKELNKTEQARKDASIKVTLETTNH